MTIDDSHHLTPLDRQRLREVSRPAESLAELEATMVRVGLDLDAVRTRHRRAMDRHRADSLVPDRVPDHAAADIRRAADEALTEAEVSIRRDLAATLAMSRAVTAQLVELADQPNLAAIDPDVLDGANRYAPLVTAEMHGASLEQMVRRVRAAKLRGDRSELLALSMVLRPVARATRDETAWDSPEASHLAELESLLADIGQTFRDASLDDVIERSTAQARELYRLESELARAGAERGGGSPAYWLPGRG